MVGQEYYDLDFFGILFFCSPLRQH
jgi:hypothetical protein